MTLPVVTVVGAILENDKGAILLAQRPSDKPMPFLWEFPGGKVEVGESPETALTRELYEEIGITVSPKDLKAFSFVSMAYPDFHIILLGYHCRTWTGTAVAREGQGGLEWVLPENLSQYPMREANRAFIPLLQSRNHESPELLSA